MPVRRPTQTVLPDRHPDPEVRLAGGGCLGGRFEILEPLGSGGSSVVYRARDRELGCEVAVKVLRGDHHDATAVGRFRREVTVAGALERAVRWYRRMYGRGGGESGRGKWESLFGLVQALGEMGRWQLAEEEIERFEATYGASAVADAAKSYVAWRGGVGSLRRRGPPAGPPDLALYWGFEAERARGRDAASLLADVERAFAGVSEESRGLLMSLRGSLLGRLGRGREAASVAGEALERVWVDARRFPAARAHLDLATDRFVEAARRVGREELASAAAARLSAWRSAQPARGDPGPADASGPGA